MAVRARADNSRNRTARAVPDARQTYNGLLNLAYSAKLVALSIVASRQAGTRRRSMDRNIFRYIWRYSARAQVLALLMTVASFPFLYYTLELPKIIINDALAQSGSRTIFGQTLTQVHYLFALCALFLALVLVNGGFKYVINVYKGIVGERMLRRLRYDLYSRVLRFPLPQFRRVSSGEIVQMINAEVEPLGGFIGDAFALPAFQGGTLLTILAFMFVQDPILGLAAIALYPVQIVVIPRLQRQVNQLAKARVRQVRRMADRINETVAGVRDIRANDATQYERSRFSRELGVVFNIRFKIYKKKFFIKFINNFLAQLGPFFFFSIGGYLVITGDLTLGALVAVIGAQKELYAPWKELLTYYQLMMDVHIKYDQVVAQFDPAGMRPEELQSADPEPVDWAAELRAVNLILASEDGATILDNAAFGVALPSHVAIVGPAGSGKEELTLVLANLIVPDAGRVLIGDHEVQRLAESVTGRAMTYVGYPAQIFGGTIADNLLFGLKHRPLREAVRDAASQEIRTRERFEAERSGNSLYDPDGDWIDYTAAGVEDPAAITATAARVLSLVRLDREVYQMGLRGTIDPRDQPELAAAILEARRAMGDRLRDPRLGRLVEVFDPERYNTNATLAENLLFGAPIGETFEMERMAAHPYVQRIIEQAGLTTTLAEVGLKLASTMVELFADLPPDHEYFRQFSFIGADDLPEYRMLIGRIEASGLDTLSDTDRERLIALTFKLIPARHHLGLVEEELQAHVLEARRLFREHLPANLAGAVAFFDPEHYTAGATVQDNVLFGKIAYGQAQATERINELIEHVLEDLGLRERIIEAGLGAPTGVGGARLSLAQRQKLALARAILKRPEVLIAYDPIGPLDPAEQTVVLDAVLEASRGRTVIWALSRGDWAQRFDHVLVMQRGRVVEQGDYAALNKDGSALHELVAAE
jgi:ABC-type multidrug transport system fused ATPase/permease subunit